MPWWEEDLTCCWEKEVQSDNEVGVRGFISFSPKLNVMAQVVVSPSERGDFPTPCLVLRLAVTGLAATSTPSPPPSATSSAGHSHVCFTVVVVLVFMFVSVFSGEVFCYCCWFLF